MFGFLRKCAAYALAHADEHLRAIDRWQGNFTCWQAHVIRSIHQQAAIEKALLDLTPNSAMVLVDFKVLARLCVACVLIVPVIVVVQMKFNPQRYREGSTQFFGKRGICWHGAAIVFHDATELPWVLDCKDGFGRTLYLQDVIDNDTMQDGWTALSVMESILMFLRQVRRNAMRLVGACCVIMLAPLLCVPGRSGHQP